MCCGGGHDSCLDMCSCRGHALAYGKSFGHIAFDTWMISVVRRSTASRTSLGRSVHSSSGLIPLTTFVVLFILKIKYSKTARVGVRLAHGPCSQCSRRELRVLQIIFCALSPVSAIERSVCARPQRNTCTVNSPFVSSAGAFALAFTFAVAKAAAADPIRAKTAAAAWLAVAARLTSAPVRHDAAARSFCAAGLIPGGCCCSASDPSPPL